MKSGTLRVHEWPVSNCPFHTGGPSMKKNMAGIVKHNNCTTVLRHHCSRHTTNQIPPCETVIDDVAALRRLRHHANLQHLHLDRRCGNLGLVSPEITEGALE